MSTMDDAALAAEYDRARGFDRPLAERSKEAHELAEGAPVLRWCPPDGADVDERAGSEPTC